MDWARKWPAVDEDDGNEKYSQEILVEKPVSPFSVITIIDVLGGGKFCERRTLIRSFPPSVQAKGRTPLTPAALITEP